MLFRGIAHKKNFFLTLLFSTIGGICPLKAASLSCDLSAHVALLINAEDGKVLFAKNAEGAFYPASTTKVATAIYALYRKGACLDEMTTVSANAVGILPIAVRRSGKHPSYRLEYGGTSMGLKVGEQVDLKTLLYGLMLPSGNDAANVIAEMVSGTVPQFVEELNSFLREIGCKNTHFKNPHGLPDLEHVTTPADLAVMAQFGMRFPVFKEIVSSANFLKPQTNKQPEVLLLQHNALVKPKSKYFYPYATGIKIGYTIQAGHAIVASAEKGDRSLIAVVSHKESLEKRYRSTIQLFDSAFNEQKQTRTLFSAVHDVFQQEIEGAKNLLKASLAQDITISFYPSEGKSFYSHIQWDPQELPIPVRRRVGEVQIFDDSGSLWTAAPVFATKAVDPTFSYQLQKHIKHVRLWIELYRSYVGYSMAFILFSLAFMRISRSKAKKWNGQLWVKKSI